mmetsp:Transcript_48609/g.122326  ORF Transcript_48609/g.122326 Transcript_48609/m.122326 type:complete len:119 (-) Transcript_48609:147-503(-)|eukprot:CAMPEP_0177650038 /NCGR_PEP_ID=MMETSP0447-20121125/11716_1 /TAXON_ID=0 /ORGANISM="Stygamoeba regulata, Strain BSH-02190019" /LENGTH=118 /DNA_ID=CAMNT_0019152855 /DNA_START=77 /DNA_END=433 /DNA_ORIENTATION=+
MSFQMAFQELQMKLLDMTKRIDELHAKMSVANREGIRARVTKKEIDSLPEDVRCFESVGRMFILCDQAELKKTLTTQCEAKTEYFAKLKKQEDYLVRQYEDLQKNMAELMRLASEQSR